MKKQKLALFRVQNCTVKHILRHGIGDNAILFPKFLVSLQHVRHIKLSAKAILWNDIYQFLTHIIVIRDGCHQINGILDSLHLLRNLCKTFCLPLFFRILQIASRGIIQVFLQIHPVFLDI